MRKILLICLFIVSCGSSVQTVTGSNNSSKLSDYNIFLELKNSTGGTSVSGGAMGSSNVAIVGGSKYDGNSQTVQVFETIKFVFLSNNNFDIVVCLKENGANINIQDITGTTPISLAASWGNFNIVKYLKQFPHKK